MCTRCSKRGKKHLDHKIIILLHCTFSFTHNDMYTLTQESITPSAITECNTRVAEQTTDSAIECKLRNPIRAGKKLEMVVYFLLNTSALSLESKELTFNFSVSGSVDGSRQVQVRSIQLDAVSAYGLTSLYVRDCYSIINIHIHTITPSHHHTITHSHIHT